MLGSGVLKKDKELWKVSVTPVDDKKSDTKTPKREQFMALIQNLLQVNSNISNNTHITTDNIDNHNDKRKALQNSKVQNDTTEQKFSITQLKDKTENLETHKK